jgi:hypothetical protein
MVYHVMSCVCCCDSQAIESGDANPEPQISDKHMHAALAHIKPQITADMLAFYEGFRGGGS